MSVLVNSWGRKLNITLESSLFFMLSLQSHTFGLILFLISIFTRFYRNSRKIFINSEYTKPTEYRQRKESGGCCTVLFCTFLLCIVLYCTVIFFQAQLQEDLDNKVNNKIVFVKQNSSFPFSKYLLFFFHFPLYFGNRCIQSSSLALKGLWL